MLFRSAAAQPQAGFLDVGIVKVRPEKRSDFDAIIKKMVDANRKNNGDTWITSEVLYGEGNTVYYVSQRQNYAEVEKGFDAFMGALAKMAGGPAGVAKMFQDFNNCVLSSRSELRRRRVDLSSNAFGDQAALSKLVGESRWTRTVMVRVRPGHVGDYEQLAQTIRTARDRRPGAPVSVSQSVAGTQGTVFYITTLAKSLSDFDTAPTPLPQLLGQDGYQKYIKTTAESVLGTETIINRFLPELSNPPEAIAAVAPDYWRPKPAAAPKPKAKAAEAPKTQ